MSGPVLISYIALWVLVGVLTVAVWAMYHHFGQVYLSSREGRAAQGPPVGELLESLVEQDVDGDPVVVPASNEATLLVFASTGCPLCDEVRDALPAFSESRNVRAVVICRGKRNDVKRWAVGLGPAATVISDPGSAITVRHRVGVLPYGVAVDAAGRVVVKGLVNGREGLEWLADAVSLASATTQIA